jgi:simple sugar transport system permease protein
MLEGLRRTDLLPVALLLALALIGFGLLLGVLLRTSARVNTWMGLLVLPVVAPILWLGLVAALAGAAWAIVPAVLQAWRGSHVVITTIMFNFIASAFLSWLLIDVLKDPGNMTVESRSFGPGAKVPAVHELFALVGIDWPRSPLNLSVLLALLALGGVQLLLWKTRLGYALRAVGHASEAARYAGIRPRRVIVAAMALSGGLAGLVGINEVAGVQGRLLLDYVVGAGFAGIAVSLIGRNHPVGIVLASLLFGALYQGGAELAFEIPGFSRDMVYTLQGLIVLFSGAMAQVAAPTLARGWWWLQRRRAVAEPVHG